MAEHDRNPKKKMETDANDMIRDYEESSATGEEDNQTTMEWYEQARQDTIVPPDAVLTGGDVDAAWDQAASGEETVGGSTPTPDQDIVVEIGLAAGVSYEDAEPLDMSDKIDRRDDQRWELHPASSEDFGVRSHNYDISESPSNRPPASEQRPADSAKQDRRKAA
jgi:hypothetical protein